MGNEIENIFDKIQEAFGKIPDNLNILEEQIDIELQMEYFKESKNAKENPDNNSITCKDDLFNENIPIERKKKLLTDLAGIDDIEAYRIIERYNNNSDSELKDWAILALRESKMIIESSLLDEHQIIISTGLGGKQGRLRYFVVVFSKDGIDFTDFQRKIISSEFEFSLSRHNSEVEKINNFTDYSTILCLLPLEVAIRDVFLNAIKVCNEYGNFLNEVFIVTNVKILTDTEIKKYQKGVGNDSNSN